MDAKLILLLINLLQKNLKFKSAGARSSQKKVGGLGLCGLPGSSTPDHRLERS